MKDRVHCALDGELPLEALGTDDREQLEALAQTIATSAAALRAAPTPDLSDAVLRRIAASPEPESRRRAAALARGLAWLWQPRDLSFTLRPAYGFAAAAAAVLAITLAQPGTEPAELQRTSTAVAPEAGATPRMYVQFRLEAPSASQVALAGSFTDWEPRYTLQQTTPGVWTVMIPLEPGVHDYTFVVDGEHWIVDPEAPTVPDSFGGSNSRLFLAAPADAA